MQNIQAELHSADGKRLVLVVEDAEINRAIMGSILEESYEVIFAEDGDEALVAIEQNKAALSLVILDLIMPNMPGQEVLRRVRANPEYQDIPVIVASGDQAQEIECLNAGASDFIQKPYPGLPFIGDFPLIRIYLEVFCVGPYRYGPSYQ